MFRCGLWGVWLFARPRWRARARRAAGRGSVREAPRRPSGKPQAEPVLAPRPPAPPARPPRGRGSGTRMRARAGVHGFGYRRSRRPGPGLDELDAATRGRVDRGPGGRRARRRARGGASAECCGSTGARADGSQHAATRPGARLSTIERQYSFFENSTVRVHKHGPRTPRELTMRGTRVTRVCSDGAIPGRFWPILDFSCRRHTPRVS